MNGKLASRIKKLEALAAAQDERDRAAAPPWKSSGDPEAESFLAGVTLHEMVRALDEVPCSPGGRRAGEPLSHKALEAIVARVQALDDLIVTEGIEAARRVYGRDGPPLDS